MSTVLTVVDFRLSESLPSCKDGAGGCGGETMVGAMYVWPATLLGADGINNGETDGKCTFSDILQWIITPCAHQCNSRQDRHR